MQQQQQPPPGTGFVEDRGEAAARVERLLGGYTFCDGALLEDALTHSVHPRDDTGGPARQRRLEFLGDAAIGLAFSTIFYREDLTLDEGDLTTLRSANVSTQKLALVAVRRNLYPLLRRYNLVLMDHEDAWRRPAASEADGVGGRQRRGRRCPRPAASGAAVSEAGGVEGGGVGSRQGRRAAASKEAGGVGGSGVRGRRRRGRRRRKPTGSGGGSVGGGRRRRRAAGGAAFTLDLGFKVITNREEASFIYYSTSVTVGEKKP